MKFIHAADIHLDSPLRGLARRAGERADALLGATREAFIRLIDTAIAEEIAFLLIAGDVYDGDWKDFSTGVFFARQLKRLSDRGIRTAIIKGNHDAANLMTRALTLPPLVHVFSAERAETLRWDELGVALHGRSFPERAMPQNLAQDYPAPVAGLLNIGLLHTSLTGREGHDTYAPCTPEQLAAHGYDYWALGHVHAREVVSQDPWIVFSGNLQGRHANEEGEKGATLVEVQAGRVARVQPLALDVLRWHRAHADLTGAEDWDAVAAAIAAAVAPHAASAGERLLALRLRLAGETPLHAALAADPERLQAEAEAAAARHAVDPFVEKIELATAAPRLQRAADGDGDALSAICGTLDALLADPDALAGFVAELRDSLGKHLPAPLREESGLAKLEADGLPQLLRDAADGLLAGLTPAGARP